MKLLLRSALVAFVMLTATAGEAAAQGSCTAISYGAPPATGFVALGEVDCFTFSGAVGNRVRVRVAETSGDLQARTDVRRPAGTSACGPATTTEVTCTLDAAGTWTIRVDGADSLQQGNYAIAIQRLNSPVACSTVTPSGAPQSRTIDAAAEMDCYTFSGVAGARMRVRVAETTAGLTARQEVIAPDGTTLCFATIAADRDCTVTVAGTHKILVTDGIGPGTGGYAIKIQRLDSPSGCTTVAFGDAPVTGTTSGPGDIDCFRFAGATGDQVRHSVARISGSGATLKEFVRPAGTTVCGAGAPRCVLDTTGTHTLLVTSDAQNASGDYRLSLQRLNNPVGCTPSSYGDAPVAGLANPGELDCYTFAASNGDRLRFLLAVISGGTVQDSVARPNGTILCSGDTSQTQGTDGSCAIDTSGTHTLVVENLNSTVVDYRLSLQRHIAPVGCVTAAFGAAPLNGAISSVAERDCIRFNAADGDRVRIRGINTGGTLDAAMALLDPNGEFLSCNPIDGDTRDCTVETTGSHAVLVNDASVSRHGTGDYAFAVQRLNQPVGCTALTVGAAPIAGAITAPAEMRCYRFTGSSGARVRVALPVTGGALVRSAVLLAPSGQSECSLPGLCGLTGTGQHSIVVQDLAGTQTGDYAVAVQRLNSPPAGTCSALGFGAAPVQAAIDAPAEMDCYSFSGSAGSRVRIRIAGTSGTLAPSVLVVRQNGTTACAEATSLDVTCDIDTTGQHRIIVADAAFGPKTGGYGIGLQRLNSPPGCATIALNGPPETHSIDAPAETDCYRYTGAAGARVRVRVIGSGALVPRMEMLRAAGTTLCSGRDFTTKALTCVLDESGAARFLVGDTSGKLAGGYTLLVKRLNSPVGCAPIAFGTAPLTGSIDAAAELDCFTFGAAAGDRVRFDAARTSGTLSFPVEVLRPNGSTAGIFCTFNECVLDTAGTYTALIGDSTGSETGGYALGVQRMNDPVGCSPIAFGAAPSTGAFTGPAQMHCFTFTAAVGDRLDVTAVGPTGSGELTTRLHRPDGAGASCVIGFNTCSVTVAGRHTITVESDDNAAVPYSVALQRLNSPVGCTALGFGVPTASDISAAAERDCYTFEGAVGDRIRVSAMPTSPGMTVRARIVKPNGVAMSSTCSFLGQDSTCVLTAPGTHTLIVSTLQDVGTGGYALEAQRANDPEGCTPLTTGTPAGGSIDGPAEFDCFTFAGTAGTTAVLALQETSGTLLGKMEVLRPNGTRMCGPTTTTSQDCLLDTTGQHTVIVGDDVRTATGVYTLTRSA